MTEASTAVRLARFRDDSPPAAKRAARRLSVTTGRLTHQARMLPGFLIMGAQRGGTTSMFRALSQHPAVMKAVLHKGVHYFDTGYDNGPAWYQGHFPLRVRAARVQRATGEVPLAFEASPYYMFHPLAAQRISRDLPGVKLLVLVRDPVERAYSAHAHELARGFETEPFERAVELEDKRLAGEADRIISQPGYLSRSHQHQAYVTRGHYDDQLERLQELFGRDRLHVVDSGRFFSDPEPVYDEVIDFLGLRQRSYPVFERHNARPRSPMPETLRAQLTEHFQPHDERLARWLGRAPSWRL
ncbi:MAG: sulfotransferase domain-containing protein [Actinomycetota bacterium]|nr:sulfotransferase domain-containing protein [Actinomycetota bacterium]